jgi:acetyl esterase/lipase
MNQHNPRASVAPAVAKVLHFLAERPGDKRPVSELGPEAARARARDLWVGYWSAEPPFIANVRDEVVKTTDRDIPVRIYDPQSSGDRPIFYFHGGGWVTGDLDTHDGLARRIAQFSGRPVVSVDYRRAPENPYPAPLDDCVAAVATVATGKADIGIEAPRFGLSGDSAGATLALGTALRLRDEGLPRPSAAALIYGSYDPAMSGESYEHFGGGDFLLSSADIRWYQQQFLGELSRDPPVYVAPLQANLEGLPPLFIAAAECDPLRDDSLALAGAAKKAGIPHELRVWEGMVHASAGMSRALDQTDRHLAELGVWLARMLA